jgi:hypothetical protein
MVSLGNPFASLGAAALDRVLGAVIEPPVRLETVRREDFSNALLGELHAMARSLMAEEFSHFRVHAEANDLVHVFRRVDTGEVMGFQFWRTAPIELPRSRVILGGKLRMRPELRRRGLHLLSGFLVFLQNKARNPGVRYYRLSLASLFGFVSLTEALADYQFFDPRASQGGEAGALREAFVKLAAESHFRVDEETGNFFVDIFMTPETLSRYSQAYFERPAAKVYAEKNPAYRTNGCYVGFWWTFSVENLLAMGKAIGRKMGRRAAGALRSGSRR